MADIEGGKQEAAVHAPSWASKNLNIPTIVGVIGLIFAAGGAFITSITNYNDMRFRIDQSETNRKEGREQLDKRMAGLEKQLADQQKLQENVPYRLGVVEQQIIQQNQRLDSFFSRFDTKIDTIGREVGTLGTKVEVLSQKIDGLVPPQRRTDALPLPKAREAALQ